MAPGDDIYAVIDRALHLSPLDMTSVSALFDVPLTHTPDPGNPYIRILVAEIPEPSPVQRLELRVPAEGTGTALLILTTRSNGAVPIATLRSRYGPPVRVEGPRAAAPLGTPTYETYEGAWGRLTFGFLPAEKNALREIIIERK